MFKVTYSYFGKYHHEKTFETHKQAKGFFFGISKNKKVTKAELKKVA